MKPDCKCARLRQWRTSTQQIQSDPEKTQCLEHENKEPKKSILAHPLEQMLYVGAVKGTLGAHFANAFRQHLECYRRNWCRFVSRLPVKNSISLFLDMQARSPVTQLAARSA